MRRSFILLCCLLCCFITASANSIDWRVGQRISLVGSQSATYYNRSYVIPKFQVENLNFPQIELNGELLAFSDHNRNYNSGEIKELYLSFSKELYTVSAGAKTFSFSETFGVNIMDILSPRNYESYILDDTFWSYRSVWAMDLNLFFDKLTAHLILIPRASRPKFPELDSPYDLRKKLGVSRFRLPEYSWLDDGEAALRLGYLSDSGIDATLLFATHLGRQMTLVINPALEIEWQNRRVTTFGTTFNYSYGDWVYRGDFLYTHDDLVPNGLFSVKSSRHWQSIVGADWSGSSEKFIGVQHHFDSVENNHWASFLYRHLLLSERLELEGMFFTGINSDDLWLRPRIGWLADSYALHLQYDLLDASVSSGVLGHFKYGDRLLFSGEYFF